MIKINPYLNFAGNTEEAFNFYKSVFGGSFSMIQRFKETPEVGNVAEGEQDKLMHVSLPISDSSTLMGTDVLESMGYKLVVGNNVSLSVEVGSEAEVDRIFKGLSEGGNVTMPLGKTFWNAYYGMVTDKFGIYWMVSYQYPK